MPDPEDPKRQHILLPISDRGMPFIRYALGDHVVAATGDCTCGRTYLGWRESWAEWRTTANAGWSLVSGISITEDFATSSGVEQVQVIQDRLIT